jgi:pimeloyl-ACP methyl ester carboxylesterase
MLSAIISLNHYIVCGSLLSAQKLLTAFVLAVILTISTQHNVHAENTMTSLQKLDRPEITGVLFHPRGTVKSASPEGATNIDIPVAEDIIIGNRLFTADKEAPIILFFHGNGETVPDYDDIGPIYARLGLNFLVTDYRGYGWSTGTPSASTLISDGQIIFDKITGWLTDNGYTGKLFVMGRSMGSAPAIDIAAQNHEGLSGLIIESGFAETIPLARTLGIDLEALGISEEDCFNNIAKIMKVTIPTFILHGQQDSLIPLWHAQKLHGACGAKSKEMQIVPGADHNTLIAVAGMLYFQTIKGYIDKVTGVSNWRKRREKFRQ